MIYITVQKKQQKIFKIRIKGHSHMTNNQKIDPLCASVSAVVLGTINACKNTEDLKTLSIKKEPGDISFINLNNNEKNNTVLTVMIIQLKTIVLYFKTGIKITQIKLK